MNNSSYHKTCAPLLTLAAATLILAGCSKTENSLQDNRTELRLTSAIEKTRAGSANTQSTQIASGEKVTVWVTDSGNSTSLYAVELTAGNNGALTGATMYYPQTGNGVNITALHGDFTLSGNGIPSPMPSSIDFSVSADQSTSGGANYLKSDLLYASQSAKRSSAAVQLQFYHLLSKLELNISKSTEVTDGITSVTLDGVALGGTFAPGSITDISTQTSRAASVVAVVESAEASKTITLGNSISSTNEAIVVPQDISDKTLTFTLASGGKLIYTFPTSTTFASGKKYVYNVTLKLTGLGVTSSIENWATTDAASGDAMMPDAS